eukprot:g16897.t1
MIEFALQFEREQLESDAMVSQLSKGNYKELREELVRVDWKGSPVDKMVEQQWQEIFDVIQEAQQKFIPKKKKYTKGRMRLTREIKVSTKAKGKTYNVVKITRKPLKISRGQTNRAIWVEKIKYE